MFARNVLLKLEAWLESPSARNMAVIILTSSVAIVVPSLCGFALAIHIIVTLVIDRLAGTKIKNVKPI